MKIAQILDRPIAYHRIFVTLTGSVKAAVMLSQALYWQPRSRQKDGWWYKTAEEWEEETGLTRHEQATARKDCEPFLMAELRGVPATLYWKVNEDAISSALFDENSETSFTESGKLVLRKVENINKNTETTSDTTQAIVNSSNLKVDAILENELKASSKSWSNVPEQFIPYCKAFCESTTLKYSKKNFNEWVSTFSDWMNEGYTPDMITDAVNQICSDPRPTAIVRPSSIDWKLKDMKVKRANNPHRTVYVNVPDKTNTGLSPEEYERWKQTRVSV